MTDHVGDAYRKVRDATVCNPDLSTAESLGVLQQVSFELLANNQRQIDKAIAQEAQNANGYAGDPGDVIPFGIDRD